MSSLALLVMTCITIPCVSKENKKERPQIKTYEEAVTAFNKIFNVSSEWSEQFEVYPDNRLYVDTRNSNMCFVEKDGQVRTWKYCKVSGNNNCKSVEQNSVGDFLNWLKDDLGIKEKYFEVLAQQIETDYKAKIADTMVKVQDWDKAFSLLYNYLVGDPDGYISVYVKDGKILEIPYSAFPARALDEDQFIKAVCELDEMIASGSVEGEINACTYLASKNVFRKIGKPDFGYLNYREDWYRVEGKETQYQKGNFKTWNNKYADNLREVADLILDNPGKVYAVAADGNLYDVGEKRYIVADEAYLSQLKYEFKRPSVNWIEIVLLICAAVVVCGVGALLFIYRDKIFGKRSKGRGREKSAPSKNLSKAGKKPESDKRTSPHKDGDSGFIAQLQDIASGEQPSAAEVLRVFDRHFKTKTKETLNNILEERDELKAKAEVLDTFKTKAKGVKTIKALLSEIDLLLETKRGGYEKDYDEEIAKMGTYAQKYHEFVHLISEGAVMEYLDAIKKEYKSFPEVKTVSRLVRKARHTSSDPLEQIGVILGDADHAMHSAYQSQVRDAQAYARIGKMLRSNDTGMEQDSYLQSMVDNALAMDELVDVDKYIDFALKFKASDEKADSQFVSVAEAARRKYNAINAAVESMSDASVALMAKDTLNFWDRLSYFLLLASTSKALYKANETDYDDKISVAVDAFKNDILYLYMTRNLLSVVNDASVGKDSFEDDILGSRVAAKVADYNGGCASESRLNMDEETIRTCMEQCIEVVRKIRREEQMTEAFTKLWEKCVKEFSSEVSTKTDKNWISGKSVQIALYMADVLRHLIAGSDECYCRNYTYLIKGTMVEGDHEYIKDDYRYSDQYSNFIYKFLEECGVSDIDLIVNNFRIKI